MYFQELDFVEQPKLIELPLSAVIAAIAQSGFDKFPRQSLRQGTIVVLDLLRHVRLVFETRKASSFNDRGRSFRL